MIGIQSKDHCRAKVALSSISSSVSPNLSDASRRFSSLSFCLREFPMRRSFSFCEASLKPAPDA